MARTNARLLLFVSLTFWIAILRLGAFWLLTIREWTGEQSLSLLPLVIVLYPEALVLPKDHIWTEWAALSFSLFLCVGSAAFAGTIVLSRFFTRGGEA
ncbi:MAG: hypothetical protein MI725_01085 [Pirellulales bacterium]|nr:hypothetical protein [Pirellulales bacterium]